MTDDEKVIQYIIEKIKTAKAVFIMDKYYKWEFYGNIPKPHDMPKEVTEPLVHLDPDNPDAWWNPIEFYNIPEDVR